MLSRFFRFTRRRRSRSSSRSMLRQKSLSPTSPRPYLLRQRSRSVSPMKPSLNRSVNAKNQNENRNMNLPPYSDEHVLVEVAKINKELRKKGKYELRVDYYDQIYEDVHHYYGNNSGFGNQRVLMICLLHEEKCISSLFFERVTRDGKKQIDINVATKPEYEKRGINSFLHAVAIRVMHLGFKYKEIYSSAINPISAWILIKDYDVSTSRSRSTEKIKDRFPTFRSLQNYYKDATLRIKVPIQKNAAKALEIEKNFLDNFTYY